jgi:PAS domain S-box-containing protein
MSDPIRVLLVDDNPRFADVAAEHLRREDGRISVETVTDPREAFEALGGDSFDCIVSDHDMSGQDGIEFLETVREEYPELPFVLFTGKGSEAVASEAISAGVTDYLRKKGESSQYTVLANRIANAVQRYRSQRAVEETERKLSRIAEHTDDVLFLFEGDWSDLLFVNSAYEAVWGGSIAELERDPTSFLEYVHPEDREEVTRSMERVSNGERVTIEYRLVRPDGERRWLRAEGTPTFDDGEVDRIVGFVRDITDERERRHKSSLLDQVFKQVPVHMYVKDEAGRHVRVSEHHVDDPERYLGRTDRELLPGEFGEETYADDMRVIETGEPILDKEEYLPDREDWHLTSKVPWYGEEGEIRGVIGVTKSITERKEYERELERQNERLDEFASVVSHDLRNPLNVARGRLKLLREECESDHLEDIAAAHERMETLIGNLLSLAREGKQVSDVEPVDLADLAGECWTTVGTADARLEIRTTRTIPADPTRLTQLFENLFRNAVEHGATGPRSEAVGDAVGNGSTGSRPGSDRAADRGGTDVTIVVGDLEDSGGFFVEDDGPGIPAEDRDRVFEAGHSTTEDGSGFGLPIVNEIVEAHGWEIAACESEAGGVRFEITGVEPGE